MRKLITLTILALLTACGGGGSDAPAAQPVAVTPKLKVYILAGQSNMFGADAIAAPNGVQDLAESGQQTDVDRTVRFTFSTRALQAPWGDVRGHAGYWLGEATIGGQTVKVHGPEVGFNRGMGGHIAVVKYADNFTELEAGRSPWVRPGSCWTAWQAFVDKQLAALGEPYEVAGFVWFQGIDDGFLRRERAPYEADLRQLVGDLRGKFGDKPLVIVHELNSVLVGPAAMQPIRDAQSAVATLPRTAIVSADDLPLATPHHLNAQAQLVLGQRIATAMKGLQ